MPAQKHTKQIAKNRRATYEYELTDRFEAGLELRGTEVKSLRQGFGQITEAHVRVTNGEAWLMGARIQPYSHASHENHAPARPRKLLLSKREISQLRRGQQEKGLTIVPLQLYFKGPWVKIEIALGRGKKLHDKRQDLRKKEDRKELARATRRR